MAMTRRMTSKLNQDRKRLKACENDENWSNMLPDILFSIIMRLGVVDFIAFNGVCKPWRTFAVSNRKTFLLSRPPMHLILSDQLAKKKKCFLEDREGRTFTTILPRSSDRVCVGSTCGYLILFGWKTCDFRLVNLITRHELRFPRFPFYVGPDLEGFRYALVFSPKMSSWVFVISITFSSRVSFSLPCKQATWTYLHSDSRILDLHFFQGKVYALGKGSTLCEVILGPTPMLKKLEMKNRMKPKVLYPELTTLGGKLCVMGSRSKGHVGSFQVGFEQMRWLLDPAELMEKYEYFASFLRCGLTKGLFWADLWNLDSADGHDYKCVPYTTFMWYCHHDCLDVNFLHE